MANPRTYISFCPACFPEFRMPIASPRAGFLPMPMLALLLLLATTPFWLARLGLYQ